MQISAIIPNYNCARLLPKAVQSLIDQTEPVTEIIIVDDASTDDSLAVIESFMKKHPHIRLIRHDKNQGVNQTLNHGIKEAIGDYVLNGAADDWYDPHSVALAKKAICEHPGVGLVCGNAILHRYNSSKPFLRNICFPKNSFITPEKFKSILNTQYVGFNGASFMNRQAFLAAGAFRPEAAWYADWLMYFILTFQHGLYYADETFANISIRQDSYSQNIHIWEKEKHAIANTITILQQKYPQFWHHFRNAALLPHYDMRYIPLFLLSPTLRPYFSLRLLWRLLITNKLIVRLGRLFPHWVVLKVRKLLKA